MLSLHYLVKEKEIMHKVWITAGTAAVLASSLISAQAAAQKGLVSSGNVAPVRTTTLSGARVGTAAPKALVPGNPFGFQQAGNGKFSLGGGFPPFQPALVSNSLFSFPPTSPAKIAPAMSSVFGFDGMSDLDQVSAGTGIYQNSQSDLEPPDQALAVGNGFVLEAINNAVAVYKTDGTVATVPIPMYQILGLPPVFNQTTQTYGPASLSDPRAYYDPATKRFFVEEWGTGQDTGGNATGTSAIYLAVSQTSDPTGAYTVYSFDTTFDPTLAPVNGQPIHILPDYVQIGADASGFYMSINQFDLLGNQGFVGPRILAVSKAALVAGKSTPIVSFSGGDLYNSNAGFTVQPAKTPAGGAYATGAGGTEYFLSSIYSNSAVAQIGIWGISNTSSLNTAAPSLTLTDTLMTSLPYTQPTPAIQKAGPYPLGTSAHFPEEQLDSSDTRMTQVTYVLGHLYSAVETSFPDSSGRIPFGTDNGFTYFSIAPSVDTAGSVSGAVSRQSYAHVTGETLSYPSFGISSTGGAVITCALIGPDFFPSAAYVPLDSHLKATTVDISSAGVAPDDGFTGYFNTDSSGNPLQGVARWGDYSQAQPDENGNMWLAQELVSTKSNTHRTGGANYGTFITKLQPSGSFGYAPQPNKP